MFRITLAKPSYPPGGRVQLVLSLDLKEPVKARGISVKLTCTERSIVKVSRMMDQYDLDRAAELGVPYSGMMKTRDEERTSVFYEKEIKIAPEGTFTRGVYRVQLPLPANAPPTSRELGHDNKITAWKVFAKLDIPLAPDISDEKEVIVGGLYVP